jgi:hypothetical protein
MRDAGAYTDTGRTNCCIDPFTGKPEPGSYGNEQLDVQTFADWGVDQINGATPKQPLFFFQLVFLVSVS